MLKRLVGSRSISSIGAETGYWLTPADTSINCRWLVSILACCMISFHCFFFTSASTEKTSPALTMTELHSTLVHSSVLTILWTIRSTYVSMDGKTRWWKAFWDFSAFQVLSCWLIFHVVPVYLTMSHKDRASHLLGAQRWLFFRPQAVLPKRSVYLLHQVEFQVWVTRLSTEKFVFYHCLNCRWFFG